MNLMMSFDWYLMCCVILNGIVICDVSVVIG